MPYCFGDHTLDEKALRLTRAGQTIAVPRRVFDLLAHLLAHRQRAVSRDELIQHIWGRDNVSYHQLAQVVLAARQLLNDTGDTQACIRTVTGFGYHWVGSVQELAAPQPAPDAPSANPVVPVSQPPLPAVPPAEAPSLATTEEQLARVERLEAAPHLPQPASAPPTGYSRTAIGMALTMCVAAGIYAYSGRSRPSTDAALQRTATPSPAQPATDPAISPLAQLHRLLDQGDLEGVREGLASLPPEWTDHLDSWLLRIQLDLRRGYWSRAEHKLKEAMDRYPAHSDPVAHGRLLTKQLELGRRTGMTPQQLVAVAERAKVLLMQERSGSAVHTARLAEAHRTLGRAMLINGQFDLAQQELMAAADLYQKADMPLPLINTQIALARVWMRQGRLTDALAQLQLNVQQLTELQTPVLAISALNTAARIQIELLQWHEALASSDQAMQLLRQAPDLRVKHRTREIRTWILTGLGRLRDAESLLLDTLHPEPDYFSIVPLVLQLENRQSAQALETAMTLYSLPWNTEAGDVLYEDREGVLLSWVLAAHQLRSQGQPLPMADAEQTAVLANPQTPAGQIARGRWLWMNGNVAAAEAELRAVLDQVRRSQRRLHMLLATEALVDLYLAQDNRTAAANAVAEFRASQPAVMEQEYRVQVLRLRLARGAVDESDFSALLASVTANSGERRGHLQLEQWLSPDQPAQTAQADSEP